MDQTFEKLTSVERGQAKRMQHVAFNTYTREAWVQNLPRILRKPTGPMNVLSRKWREIDRLDMNALDNVEHGSQINASLLFKHDNKRNVGWY